MGKRIAGYHYDKDMPGERACLVGLRTTGHSQHAWTFLEVDPTTEVLSEV